MKTLIVAAGRFDEAFAERIAAGREPRLDVFELQKALGADLVDYRAVDESPSLPVKAVRSILGSSAAAAVIAAGASERYDAIFTTGEDIGIPLAAQLKARRSQTAHVMIAHTLTPAKKRIFFRLGIASHIGRILCYSTNEERNMLDRLRLPAEKVRRIYFHADVQFFRPSPVPPEPDLICSAGQLLRDYPSLLRAAEGLGVRVCIAAGSPWIPHELRPSGSLPSYVDWRRYDRFELRELYARAAVAVVPIIQNEYQTGVSTILEMMAMGKCVIASRTRGQTDTIQDGVTGIYVPPGDPAALRAALQRLLARPHEAQRIGWAARAWVEEKASLDIFVERVAGQLREAFSARGGQVQ
jgi:glycosyltransferase involved in cell wall biosynthesis